MYKIKEVAKKFEINENALRFYESKGLITPIRDENNYRLYSLRDLTSIQMILLYRQMGFSIETIKSLIKENETCLVMDLFARQYQAVNAHIHDMLQIRESLEKSIVSLFDQDTITEEMICNMQETTKVIARMNHWQDKWGFDDWADTYDVDIRKAGHPIPFYDHYDEVISQTASRASEKQGKLVEIGIGTGNLMQAILKEGKIKLEDAVGIDQSLNMLRKTKRKLPDLKVKLGTFLQLPMDARSCDTIVTSYAFHHCNDEEKRWALIEMDRILKSRGRIVITDVMFQDKESKGEFMSQCSKQKLSIIEDEYFGFVDQIEEVLETLGYHCEHRAIDEFVWMIVADRQN